MRRRTTKLKIILSGLMFLILGEAIQAVNVTVSPGQNPTVTLNIPQPGTPDSITLYPASCFGFSQDPYIYNNPSGLWWDAGNHTFSVVFLSGGATSADVTILGKLKYTCGQGGGGTAPVTEFDFSLPGVAVLGNAVGAVFELPDWIWWMEGEGISCQVRFFANAGTVTAVTPNYQWVGDTLGIVGGSGFANQLLSFGSTVASGAASKEGQIKGSFTAIQVDGQGNFSAEATSILMKALKVVFDRVVIQGGDTRGYITGQNTYTLDVPVQMVAACIFTPQPGIPIQGRLPQQINAQGIIFAGANSLQRTSEGNFVWDGFQETGVGNWAPNGEFIVSGSDLPGVTATPPPTFTQLKFNASPGFKTYIQLKIGGRLWKTYGVNTWNWSADWVISDSPTGSLQVTGGQGGSATTEDPILSGTPFNQLPLVPYP